MVGTSATLSRDSKARLAHVIGCSDSGDSGGNNGRRSGVDDWLVVTSISVPVAVVFGRRLESLGVSTQTVADRLQKLQPGVRAVVVSLNARLDPRVVLNVAFLFRPPNFNTTPDPVYVGHAVDRNILQVRRIAVTFDRVWFFHASAESPHSGAEIDNWTRLNINSVLQNRLQSGGFYAYIVLYVSHSPDPAFTSYWKFSFFHFLVLQIQRPPSANAAYADYQLQRTCIGRYGAVVTACQATLVAVINGHRPPSSAQVPAASAACRALTTNTTVAWTTAHDDISPAAPTSHGAQQLQRQCPSSHRTCSDILTPIIRLRLLTISRRVYSVTVAKN